MKHQQAADTLATLSHETRLAAFRHLVQAGPDGLSVGALREHLGITATNLTAHLNLLRRAALVLDRREGRVIRVRANYLRMNALIAYLTEKCCAGQSECGPATVCKPASKKASR
jgi:DNA-binding transcriptional ArsR family regulator